MSEKEEENEERKKNQEIDFKAKGEKKRIDSFGDRGV